MEERMTESDFTMRIPPDLERAFMETLWAYSDWDRGGPEPEISLERRPFKLSAVCGLLANFDAPMPDVIYDQLTSLMDAANADLTEELTNNRSYVVGARCLLRLIDARTAEYRRRDEWRRNN
jgi:hypothetical protein